MPRTTALNVLACVVALAYATATGVVSWMMTFGGGHFTDVVYGSLLSILLAFPLSLVNLVVYPWAAGALPGEAWNVLLNAWPGLVQAAVVGRLLWRPSGRPRLWAGMGAAVFVTFLTLVSAWDLLAGQWPPHRPYGWSVLVCGMLQVAALAILVTRLIARGGRADHSTSG
ncbi:hypothetical protein ACFFOP_07415 [Sinosporangium siamense]